MHESEKWKSSHSVVSDSSRPHGLQPTGVLHPWDFPGKSTGVGCHCLLLFPLYISPKYGTSLPASTTEARISLPYLTAKVEQKKLPRVLIKIMKTHAILILFLLHHYQWLIFTSLKYVWKYRKKKKKTDQKEETSDKKRNRRNLEPFIKMWESKLEQW